MKTIKNKKAMKSKKMGRIVIDLCYVVDMNNEDMVQEAKRMFFEDIMNSLKYDELIDYMEVIEDKEATEKDIPQHLKDVIFCSDSN